MAKDRNETVISTPNGATYQVVNGVTYFKLQSEFEGDYTKNCGLLGNEIDENFYFLRGYDIKDVSYDEETKILTITRVDSDYDPIEIPLGEEIAKDRPEFEYNPETGKLTVTYPDGEEMVAEGFFIENSFKVNTDPTIKGDGTPTNPLRLSPVERTGMYAPVDNIIDTTNGEEVPENLPCGARFITKEDINALGRLYPYSDVKEIQAALEEENSPWRVATRKDWDELLNALEEDDEVKNHHISSGLTWKGEIAGAQLKSSEMWEESGEIGGLNYGGFNALPAGFINDAGERVGFGRRTYFWCYGAKEDGDVDVKELRHNESRVANDDFGEESRTMCAVRFVRDYEPDCVNEYEDILNTNLPTGVISKCDYSKVWTLANFYGDKFGGMLPDEDAEPTRTAYFINEIGKDGKLYKKKMNEGDAVYVVEDGKEYRLQKDDLVDVFKETEDLIKNTSDAINENLDNLSAATETAMRDTREELDSLINELSGATVAEIERSIEKDEELEDALTALTAAMGQEIADLSGATELAIADLSGATELAITALSGATELAIADAMSSADDKIDALSGNMETLLSDIEGVKSDIAELSASTEELSAATESALQLLDSSVESLSASVENAVSELSSDIENVRTDTQILVSTMSGLNQSVQEAITITSANTLNAAKEYTDDKIDEVLADEDKIVSIKYDSQLGYITLVKADGSECDDKIPVSEFIKDEVLTNVEFDEANQSLIFIWNDEYSSRTEIPLTALANVYTVASGSNTYLKFTGQELSAIVDGEGGFLKTLATTEFAQNAAQDAASAAVAPVRTYIELLKGDDNEPASISHKIGDKLITNGIISGSVEDSLMKIVNVNGELKYYVSSKANDMYYVKPDGTTTNLNEYITALENRVAELESGMTAMEERVAGIESAGINEADVREIIKNYLEGTEREIKITEVGDKLKVGFTDDAIFGYIASSPIQPNS